MGRHGLPEQWAGDKGGRARGGSPPGTDVLVKLWVDPDWPGSLVVMEGVGPAEDLGSEALSLLGLMPGGKDPTLHCKADINTF